MKEKNLELEREFELERLILFSDAVFAIAITLLIIEIKFPEVDKGAATAQIFTAFIPVIIQFTAFGLSFFFIGIAWTRHLLLCRYVKKFNNGLLRRNLVLLFFIVCFPFSVSGITEHIRPGFLLPIYIYMVNISGVFLAQYALLKYVFHTKPQLSVAGKADEKKYLFLKTQGNTFIFVSIVIAYLTLSLLFPHFYYIGALFYLLPILMLTYHRKIKKYKPTDAEIDL